MRRREFTGLLGVAAAWPFAARAQELKRPVRIGVLRTSPTPERYLSALRRGLAERGYAEGRDYVLVYRFGDGNPRRLPELAAALVATGVDLILAEGQTVGQAARSATATIPIVLAGSPDPVRAGLVDSLARPGGNVTGLALQPHELSGKLLELVKELVRGLTRVALVMPRLAWALFRTELTEAARTLGLDMVHIELALSDIDAAVRRAAEKAQGAVVLGRPFFSAAQMKLMVERAAAHRLPAIYQSRDFVEFGGLASYGIDTPDLYRRAATFVDKILKGAKPAELPIELPTKFELVISMKAATALGLTISPILLARADEVIE